MLLIVSLSKLVQILENSNKIKVICKKKIQDSIWYEEIMFSYLVIILNN